MIMIVLYSSDVSFIDVLFAEELGLVLEVSQSDMQHVIDAYSAVNTPCTLIGHSMKSEKKVRFNLYMHFILPICFMVYHFLLIRP